MSARQSVLCYALILAIVGFLASGVRAQTSIRIVVPAPPGGAGDIVARVLTEQVARAGASDGGREPPRRRHHDRYRGRRTRRPRRQHAADHRALSRHRSASAKAELRSADRPGADLPSRELAGGDRGQQRIAVSDACRLHRCCARQARRGDVRGGRAGNRPACRV